MSYTLTVTLTSVDPNAGPFDIYAEPSHTLLLNDVTATTLFAGVNVIITNPLDTSVSVYSDNILCNNVVTHPIPTTTTTMNPYCYEIDATGSVADMIWMGPDGLQGDTLDDEIYSICANPGSISITTISGPDPIITGGDTICVNESDCWPSFDMVVAVGKTISQTLIRRVKSTRSYICDFGDSSTPRAFAAGDNWWDPANHYSPTNPHIYATPFNGTISLKAPSLKSFTYLDCYGVTPTQRDVIINGINIKKLTGLKYFSSVWVTLTCDLSDLSSVLEEIRVNYGTVTGNTIDLASTIVHFQFNYYVNATFTGDIADFTNPNIVRIDFYGSNTVYGNFSTLTARALLTHIDIEGNNTLNFNINQLPINLTYLRVLGDNTAHGLIDNIPNSLVTLDIYGWNYVSGNLLGLVGKTNLREIQIINNNTSPNSNTIDGDITNIPDSVIILNITGDNTIYGDVADLPQGLISDLYVSVTIWGQNTIDGNISGIPVKMNKFSIRGYNQITGNLNGISTLPVIVSFEVWGNNDISGDLADTPTNIDYINVYGLNTIGTYTAGKIWPVNMKNIEINGVGTMTTPSIDALLADVYTKTWQVSDPANPTGVILKGVRTIPATNAYVTAITVQGAVVVITP